MDENIRPLSDAVLISAAQPLHGIFRALLLDQMGMDFEQQYAPHVRLVGQLDALAQALLAILRCAEVTCSYRTNESCDAGALIVTGRWHGVPLQAQVTWHLSERAGELSASVVQLPRDLACLVSTRGVTALGDYFGVMP